MFTKEQALNRAAISVKEFSEITGIAAQTVYNNAREGKIETIKLAGRRMIPAYVFMPLLEGVRK